MELKKLLDTAPSAIRREFKHRRFKKGAFIIHPGVENEFLYILVKGTAEVYRQSYSGTMFTLHRYEPYSCFGEMELFQKEEKTRSIIASSECETIVIHKGNVFQWMKKDFDFNLYLIRQLVSKLVVSSEISTRLSFLSVKERILFSIHTHQRIGDIGRFTKKMLLSEVCAPVRSVNRSLNECFDAGLIQYRDKTFTVLSLEKLELLLEDLLVE